MNWAAIAFDWNQVRAFLATAEEGSLSAAARVLGQTQPTLSRQVTSLEQALGVTLFERGPRAVSLTEAGLGLLEHVRTMGEAAARISLSASGQAQGIDGDVSITAGDMLATYALPPVLARLRAQWPGIGLTIYPSSDIRDIIRREADIAIRHVRPEHGDLVARRLPDSAAGLFASRGLLDQQGVPDNADALVRYPFVGLAPMERFLPSLSTVAPAISLDQFKVIAANGATMVELVRHGLGIGVLPVYVAKGFPDLVPILSDAVALPVPIWLVTHRELHTSRRIRLTFDLLVRALASV